VAVFAGALRGVLVREPVEHSRIDVKRRAKLAGALVLKLPVAHRGHGSYLALRPASPTHTYGEPRYPCCFSRSRSSVCSITLPMTRARQREPFGREALDVHGCDQFRRRGRGVPPARDYYTRKRSEGNKHNAAILCLARRRCDLIHKMLSTGISYGELPARPAPPLPSPSSPDPLTNP
jgi:hypothetical protein